jgi:hypothetical protein
MTLGMVWAIVSGIFAGIACGVWIRTRKVSKEWDRIKEEFSGIRKFYEWAETHDVRMVIEGQELYRSSVLELYMFNRYARSRKGLDADMGPALQVIRNDKHEVSCGHEECE